MGIELLLATFPPRQLGTNTLIGPFSYGAPTVLSWGEGSILTIGKFCSLTGTVFLGGNHRYDWVTTYPFCSFMDEFKYIKGVTQSNGNVVIGNDVWLGLGSTIMSGVTIGDGAVVGTYALVTKDVPPYAIVGGNPAKIIRYRFPQNVIDRLLQLKWWDWELNYLEKAIPLLQSQDVHALIRYGTSIGK